jgi:hypothetical protein
MYVKPWLVMVWIQVLCEDISLLHLCSTGVPRAQPVDRETTRRHMLQLGVASTMILYVYTRYKIMLASVMRRLRTHTARNRKWQTPCFMLRIIYNAGYLSKWLRQRWRCRR